MSEFANGINQSIRKILGVNTGPIIICLERNCPIPGITPVALLAMIDSEN